MRRILLLIGMFVAVALVSAPPAQASCSASVRWNGTLYAGAQMRVALPLGAPLAGGVVPACDDVILIGPDGQRMNPKPQDTPVELRPIAGVPAALALVRAEQPDFVYLAPGTLPQLKSHPLHRALFGRGGRAAERRAGCLSRRTIRAVVAPFQWGLGPLRVDTPGGRTIGVAVEPRTRVKGARRIRRHPVLAPGQRLVITGPRCGPPAHSMLVAERIRVEGDRRRGRSRLASRALRVRALSRAG